MKPATPARGTPLVSRLPAEPAFVALTAAGPSADAALLGLLDRPLNWDALINLAARERAIAPLCHRLGALRTAVVPADARERIQRFAMISDFQLMSLHERLGRILELFAANGIDALLLKGAGLAYTAYGAPTDRPMGDVDLLVREADAQRAFELALTAGWVRRRDVSQERSYEDHQHLPPLEDADGLQMGLELHTALFTHQAPFLLPPSQIWDAARRIAVGKRTAMVPCPEDQLLHAALHFGWSHEMTFGTWRTLRDVERLAAPGLVDWDRFVSRARAARGATCCFWTLRLARELTGAAIPDRVLAELSPRLPEWVVESLTEHFAELSLPFPGRPAKSVSLSRALWTLAVRPKGQGHGPSRPWLDTEDWVRDGDGMKSAKGAGLQRIVQQGYGLLRLVVHRIGA